jgi:thiamine-monophosphate kinase
MSADVRLGRGAEFDLIRAMRARWGELAVGIGDDAAVLRAPRGERLVVSTDAAVENVHFRRDWLAWEEIAYRAVTAALSDLAAMASVPHGVMVSLALSPSARDAALEIADGIGAAARDAGALILGGNIASAEQCNITTTVLGSAYSPLSRSGGRPGDLLYLTGSLGGPSAAMRAWTQGASPSAAARARFAHPVARIHEARWLATRGAIAAIDVSDGLGGDVAHLAAASDLAIEVQLERVPLVPGVDDVDVFGGEEYELLVLTRAPLPDEEFRARFGIPLTLVGRAVESGARVLFTRDGARVAAPEGYDHLSR